MLTSETAFPHTGMASSPLRIPALFLIVLTWIYLAVLILVFVGNLLMSLGILPHSGSTSTVFEDGVRTASVAFYIGIQVFVLYGLSHLRRLDSYGLAMAVSVVSAIPCFTQCFILGTPFGIWAFVLLLKPEVKKLFARQ